MAIKREATGRTLALLVRAQALAGGVVDGVQRSEAPTGGELVVNELRLQRWLSSISI